MNLRPHQELAMAFALESWRDASLLKPTEFFVDEAADLPVLSVGVDPSGQDLSAITLFERVRDGVYALRDVRSGAWDSDEALNRAFASMLRDHHRPRGYSRSHWRKLWRQNVHA